VATIEGALGIAASQNSRPWFETPRGDARLLTMRPVMVLATQGIFILEEHREAMRLEGDAR
jgi:hypothetical protein